MNRWPIVTVLMLSNVIHAELAGFEQDVVYYHAKLTSTSRTEDRTLFCVPKNTFIPSPSPTVTIVPTTPLAPTPPSIKPPVTRRVTTMPTTVATPFPSPAITRSSPTIIKPSNTVAKPSSPVAATSAKTTSSILSSEQLHQMAEAAMRAILKMMDLALRALMPSAHAAENASNLVLAPVKYEDAIKTQPFLRIPEYVQAGAIPKGGTEGQRLIVSYCEGILNSHPQRKKALGFTVGPSLANDVEAKLRFETHRSCNMPNEVVIDSVNYEGFRPDSNTFYMKRDAKGKIVGQGRITYKDFKPEDLKKVEAFYTDNSKGPKPVFKNPVERMRSLKLTLAHTLVHEAVHEAYIKEYMRRYEAIVNDPQYPPAIVVEPEKDVNAILLKIILDDRNSRLKALDEALENCNNEFHQRENSEGAYARLVYTCACDTRQTACDELARRKPTFEGPVDCLWPH